MVSAGNDGYVKVWDISSGEPQQVQQRDMKQGELFTLQFCQDIPWVVASGGSKGELAIWDLSESQIIEQRFKSSIIKGSYSSNDYDPENPGNAPKDDDWQDEDDDQGEASSSSDHDMGDGPKKKKKKNKKGKK